MKKLALAIIAVIACLPLSIAGQSAVDQLREYTQVMMLEGLPLSIIHLNDKSVPVIFQPPTLYSIRARSHEATMLYVQGSATKPMELDSSTFTIDQGGQTITSVPSNIKNFAKGKNKVGLGDRVDGVLTFAKLVDLSKPFTVKHGRDSVTFEFSDSQLKEMASPAPAH